MINDLKIVDSHVHFWDIERLEYKWLLEEPSIRRNYFPSDLLQETINYHIDIDNYFTLIHNFILNKI